MKVHPFRRTYTPLFYFDFVGTLKTEWRVCVCAERVVAFRDAKRMDEPTGDLLYTHTSPPRSLSVTIKTFIRRELIFIFRGLYNGVCSYQPVLLWTKRFVFFFFFPSVRLALRFCCTQLLYGYNFFLLLFIIKQPRSVAVRTLGALTAAHYNMQFLSVYNRMCVNTNI